MTEVLFTPISLNSNIVRLVPLTIVFFSILLFLVSILI